MSAASFRFHHPQAPDLKFVVQRDGTARLAPGQLVPGLVEAVADANDPQSVPRAVVEQAAHDFGTMNPLTMGQHTFVIRNDGTGPLRLQDGGTTCKCTVAELTGNAIPPGESGTVQLQWNSGRDPLFHHSATIVTNDPENKTIELAVTGHVTVVCAAEPAELVLGELDPVAPPSESSLTIYSQSLEGLQVTTATSSLEGLTWRIAPLEDASGTRLRARSGLKIYVTPPRGLPCGPVQGQLSLELTAANEPEPIDLVIPVSGSMAGRMSVYGAGVDPVLGIISLGVTEQGAPIERRLVLRVRDEQLPTIGELQVTVQPEFLEARIEPMGKNGIERGLYYVVLRVPAEAPQCTYLGVERARLIISANHPRLIPMTIGVEFAVMQSS